MSCRAMLGSQPGTELLEKDVVHQEALHTLPEKVFSYSLGVQSRTVFRHLPAALLLETHPCTNPDTSHCIHQAGKRNNPLFPACAARKPQLKARTSSILAGDKRRLRTDYGKCSRHLYAAHMYVCTHTHTEYSATIVKELQDNMAKRKACMAYWFTGLRFTVHLFLCIFP